MSATRAEIQRLLDKLELPIMRAFEKAALGLKSRAQINRLAAAIAARDVNAIAAAVGVRPGTWNDVTESIRSAYYEGGTFTMAADVPPAYGAEFDLANPRAEAWLRTMSSEFVTRVNLEQIEAIREVLAAGFEAGRNPLEMALDIAGRISPVTGRRQGGIVGLNGPQAELSSDMRNALSRTNGVGVLTKSDGTTVKKFWIGNDGQLKSTYTMRDRRFDATIKKAIETGKPLPKPAVNKIVGRYEDKLLRLRGETIGRTEALAALNEASDEALRQVIDEGLAPATAVKRIWRHSFSLNERSGHRKMDKQERPVNVPFDNPETGVSLMHPGEGPASEVINCRCIVEHRIDFIAVEKAKAA